MMRAKTCRLALPMNSASPGIAQSERAQRQIEVDIGRMDETVGSHRSTRLLSESAKFTAGENIRSDYERTGCRRPRYPQRLAVTSRKREIALP